MKLTRQGTRTHTAGAVNWMLALSVGLALCGCAGTPARPLAPESARDAAPTAATAAAVGAAADPVQRGRQYQHAEALYLSGRYKEATSAFEELTRAYPRDAHVWLKYGNALTRQGSYDGAATAFQTALMLDPTEGGAALNLALVRLAQAQAALDTADARLPQNSPESLQAGALQRQIKVLLGAPAGSAPAH